MCQGLRVFGSRTVMYSLLRKGSCKDILVEAMGWMPGGCVLSGLSEPSRSHQAIKRKRALSR